MKKMSLLLVLALTFSLTACSGGTQNQPTASTTSESSATSSSATTEASTMAPDAFADYPNKGITMIVPHSAGGGTDTTARFIADALGKQLGVTITVTNLPGAGGETGAQEIKKSPKDGYTIGCLSAIDITSLASSKPSAGIKFPDDFNLIANFSTTYMAYACKPGSPYADIKEFIKYAKEHPGELTVSESGTAHIFTAAAIMKELDIKFSTVNYSGGADSFAAVIGGHVDAASLTNAWAKRVYDGGGAMLVVGGDSRMPLCPDIPTWKEVGCDISYTNSMYIVATPAGVPDAINKKLIETCNALERNEALNKNLTGNGQELLFLSGDNLTKYMTDYFNKVDAVIKANPEIFMK